MHKQIDQIAFRKWLEEKPSGEIVGRAHEASSCPLAMFTGRPIPEEDEILEGWPDFFVNEIDNSREIAPFSDTSISAQEALEALDLVTGKEYFHE